MGIQAAHAVYIQARERMEELHRTLTLDSSNEEATDTSHSAAASSPTSRHRVQKLASECETLAVQHASLLKHHNSISVFPLATLRQTLTSALSTWSSSAPLWSIYVQVSHVLLLRYQKPFHFFNHHNQPFKISFSNSHLFIFSSYLYLDNPNVTYYPPPPPSGGEPLP